MHIWCILLPPFKFVQFLFSMTLGVILVASLQQIFVVEIRNEDTVRAFLCEFFFQLFNKMSLLLVVDIIESY